MAENQPDEDDDVGFGDFKFVSYSNHPLQTHQTKRVDEDEWGDFMGNFSQKQEFLGNPLRFDSLNGFTPTQNPIKPPEISQKLDLFGVFSDPSTNNPESKLGHVESEKSPVTPVVEKGWEKPRGALPLSIFGDEEEESDSVNPSFSNAADMFSSKSAATVQNGFNFGAGVGLDDLIGNLYSQAEQIKTDNGSNSNRVDGDGDFDGEGWEFKEALSENGVGDNNSVVKVENSSGLEMTSGLWEVQVETTTFDGDFQVDGKQSKNSEGTLHASVFSNIEPDSGDSFVASNGFSHTFDNGLGLETSVITQNGFVLDSLDQTKQISTENGLSSCSVDGNVGTDDNLWEFKDALSETGAVNCHKGNGEGLGYQEEAPPLSIFSNGKLDSNDSLYGEDVTSENPATHLRNGTYRQGSSPNVSFSDLLSTLYTQAEQISSVGSTGKPTENGINSAETVVNSDLVSREDDSDKNSWNFKYAFSETKTANIALGVDKKFMSESKLKNFTDLYSRLKDESHFVALRHLDGLKKAQKVTALSSEGVKAVALEEEIQAAYKILHQENVVSEEVSLEELSTRNICMDQFMHMPKFDILESEYDLSKRISLADKDLTSAIELFEHAIWMLKILTMGTMEEQSKYVTTWSKMISACAQELKYGASIWKQLLLKNVHKKILSELQAQRYFLALGEIYRVVEVLRASTTLYKPWILSSIVDHSVIFSLLEECMDVWSDSGLEGAIMSISDLISPGHDGTIKALMESIRSVHDLDVLSLQNCAFSQRESVCRLSGLSLSVVPDMKIVVWDGEHYFLTLANLWANRISSDPPQLPHLHDG